MNAKRITCDERQIVGNARMGDRIVIGRRDTFSRECAKNGRSMWRRIFPVLENDLEHVTETGSVSATEYRMCPRRAGSGTGETCRPEEGTC